MPPATGRGVCQSHEIRWDRPPVSLLVRTAVEDFGVRHERPWLPPHLLDPCRNLRIRPVRPRCLIAHPRGRRQAVHLSPAGSISLKG